MILLLLAALLQTAPILRTVDKGSMSYVDNLRRVTARTEAEWSTLWKQHAAQRDLPKVDFAKEMVVGVFLGSRPTAGVSVEVISTRVDGNALVVQYREIRPERGAVTAQVITSPFHLVAVPTPRGRNSVRKTE